MAVTLSYAHLADHVTTDSRGKPIVVGIFDVVVDAANVRPIPFPPCFLIAQFAASLADGSDHRITMRLLDADSNEVTNSPEGPIRFGTTGPGHPLSAVLISRMMPGWVSVPDHGEYTLAFYVDGEPKGGLDIRVVPAPPR